MAGHLFVFWKRDHIAQPDLRLTILSEDDLEQPPLPKDWDSRHTSVRDSARAQASCTLGRCSAHYVAVPHLSLYLKLVLNYKIQIPAGCLILSEESMG